jgi:DNA-binding NarL/FixJ family response regulator
MIHDVVSHSLIRYRSGMKVLICDDHALFREGIMVVMRGMAEGIELFEAATATGRTGAAAPAREGHDPVVATGVAVDAD